MNKKSRPRKKATVDCAILGITYRDENIILLLHYPIIKVIMMKMVTDDRKSNVSLLKHGHVVPPITDRCRQVGWVGTCRDCCSVVIMIITVVVMILLMIITVVVMMLMKMMVLAWSQRL